MNSRRSWTCFESGWATDRRGDLLGCLIMAACGALLTSPLKAKRCEDWTALRPCCNAGDGRAPWAELDLSSGPVDQGGGDLNGLWALLFLLPRGAACPVAARKGTGQPRPSKGLAPTHAAQSGGCPDNPGSSQVLPPQNRARSQSPRPALSLVKPPPPMLGVWPGFGWWGLDGNRTPVFSSAARHNLQRRGLLLQGSGQALQDTGSNRFCCSSI